MAYRNYFRSVLNDNFKILTWVLILFIAITPNFIFINSVHASAAEKWDYEPVMKDMNIHVKGYKVDQYGNAVNDYEYNTKIDPKTIANKQKMGAVGFGRLLKTSGWGLLGAAALEGLLEAVDWVIDPEAQSIWRYKKDSTANPLPGNPTCRVTDSGGKPLQFVTGEINPVRIDPKFCPIDGANAIIDILKKNYPKFGYEFFKWEVLPSIYNAGQRLDFLVQVTTPEGYKNYDRFTLRAEPAPEPPPTLEKEFLSPEQLADYANHTHADYSKPDLAQRLEPKYKPEIASDLWKPSNQWEEQNSPTVQEAQRKLDQAQPEPKKDPEIKPNPETGGSVLPKFCDWAAPVCEAIKWFKELPDNDDNTQIDVENLDETLIFDDSQRFSFDHSCPAPEQFSVSFFGASQDLEFSYQPLCDFMSMIKPFVIAGSYLIGAYIVMGLSRGSAE